MKALQMFSIPIKGLGIGKHSFEYSIEDEFFQNFENSEIKAGSFQVDVSLDKQNRMMEFHFKIEGTFSASCDRCLEQIVVPTNAHNRLLVKMGEIEGNESEEVIYIDDNEKDINLAPFILEFIHLSKSLQNVIDCEENDYEYCDLEVLDRLSSEETEEKQDPTWDQLKNIDLG